MPKSLLFLFTLACSSFRPSSLPAADSRLPGAGVELTCRNYAYETLCYPANWQAYVPGMPFEPGQKLGMGEEFYLNSNFKADAINGGVMYTIRTAPYKNWAEVSVNNLGYLKDKKREWMTNPVAERPALSPCGGGAYPCFTWLGKKKVNEFTAYYYLVSGGKDQWAKTMYVYLVKAPGIYRFEFYTHAADFGKYEKYFYAMLANFRLRKK